MNSLSCYDCIKDLKNLYINYPFLKEVDSMSLRCSLFNLENAYQKLGYPKFKSKFNKIPLEQICQLVNIKEEYTII